MAAEWDAYYERGENANDPLTVHAKAAGRWGNPTEPDDLQRPAELPAEGFDYSYGVFVGIPGQEADAVPGTLHPKVAAKLPTDVPPAYQIPHEATHRRYDAPFSVAISQSAAGFTLVAPPKMGLHFLKVLGVLLSADAAGTVKFVQGDSDGNMTADLTGAVPVATNGGFVLPPAEVGTPWLFTAPDLALGIFSVTSKVSGFVTLCYSAYDS